MYDRMIRNRFWRDEELGELGTDGALLFAGLWAMADDYGCIEYRPNIIHAEVFMIFPKVSRARCAVLLTALIDLGKVRAYEANGQSYLSIPNFLRYQELDYLRGSERPLPPWVSEEVQALYPDGRRLRKRPKITGDSGTQTEQSGRFQNIPEKSEIVGKDSNYSPSRARRNQDKTREEKTKQTKSNGASADIAVTACPDGWVDCWVKVFGDEPTRDEREGLRAMARASPLPPLDAVQWALEEARDKATSNPVGYAITAIRNYEPIKPFDVRGTVYELLEDRVLKNHRYERD